MPQATTNKIAAAALLLSIATLVYAAGGDRGEAASAVKVLQRENEDKEKRLRDLQKLSNQIDVLATKVDTLADEVTRLRNTIEGSRP